LRLFSWNFLSTMNFSFIFYFHALVGQLRWTYQMPRQNSKK
jgi:hypothetical protein